MTDRGSAAASTTAHDAREVASTTAAQASELTHHAWDEARQLVDHTRGQVRTQADDQARRAAGGMRSMSDQLRALADGRTDEAGRAGDLVRELGDRFAGYAGQLETRGLDGVLDDLGRYARRKPGSFLMACALAGFAAGRVAKAHRSNSDDDGARPLAPPSPSTRGTYGMSSYPASAGPMDPTALPMPATGAAMVVDTPATTAGYPTITTPGER